jgi:hypothetical protein
MSISVLTLAPEKDVKTQKRQQKRISRIIKHLRDQLPPEQSPTIKPNDDLIDQLVDYALEHQLLCGDDWHVIIYQTLQLLIKKLNLHALDNHNLKPFTPIILTDDSINLWHIKAFALRLLAEIDQGTLYFKN